MNGYGRFWVIIEMLRESSTYKIEDEEYIWAALSEQFKCSIPEVKEFIKDCVEKYKLFIQEDGYFYSASLLLRMIKLDEIREKRRQAGFDRWKD